jgi:hypothetical protein
MESKSINDEAVKAWKMGVLPSLLSRYDLKDIFNADECGLFFYLLPDKTFSKVKAVMGQEK